MKLNRFLARHNAMGRTAAHRALASKRVRVNGEMTSDGDLEVDRFTRVELDENVLQHPERLLYLMMHKPVGYLSATKDEEHPTVLDLIDDADKGSLHIAGRLDRNTSGLLILTNHGVWSKKFMDPTEKVPKVYHVETLEPITPDSISAFAEGFYFHTEDLTTQPADLRILDSHHARLTIYEGRYHQIKRMFHRVNNRVVSLHRESIGEIVLPANLEVGQWRFLTEAEIRSVTSLR